MKPYSKTMLCWCGGPEKCELCKPTTKDKRKLRRRKRKELKLKLKKGKEDE